MSQIKRTIFLWNNNKSRKTIPYEGLINSVNRLIYPTYLTYLGNIVIINY